MLAFQEGYPLMRDNRRNAFPIHHCAQRFGRRQGGELRQFKRAWGAAQISQGVGMRSLKALLHCEKGANAIEYALVASLIAIAAYAAFENLGNKVDAMYNNVSNHM